MRCYRRCVCNIELIEMALSGDIYVRATFVYCRRILLPEKAHAPSSTDLVVARSVVTGYQTNLAVHVCVVYMKARVACFCPCFYLSVFHRIHTPQTHIGPTLRHSLLCNLTFDLPFIFTSGFASISSPIPHSSESITSYLTALPSLLIRSLSAQSHVQLNSRSCQS